jgi:hypothetical protein
VAVEGRRGFDRFIRLPWAIYAGDPAWVPPLIAERREHFSPRNPYFEHARWQAWLAYRGERVVGRISAQVDELHLSRYRDATGFFGSLDAEDDGETFAALFGAAENWLSERGMRRVLGPYNLSVNQECGLLIEGFDSAPMVMMGHARPYYARHIEARGYIKAKDLLGYRVNIDFELPEAMRRFVAEAAGGAGRVRIRPLRRRRFDADLEILRSIFNDAWSGNWGFLPFTEAEFRALGGALKGLVHDDFVQIAEVDGEPAAMIVALPNLNAAIRDLDGRLWPSGWLKLLWRLKVAPPKSARVVLMGVRGTLQRSLLGSVLGYAVIAALRTPGLKRGITEVELSWVLEDNQSMRTMIESLGARVCKRYRIFERVLS